MFTTNSARLAKNAYKNYAFLAPKGGCACPPSSEPFAQIPVAPNRTAIPESYWRRALWSFLQFFAVAWTGGGAQTSAVLLVVVSTGVPTIIRSALAMLPPHCPFD